MYKITKQGNDFSYKQIKNGVDERFGWAWLETEIKDTPENKINVSVFFQETIPQCETKYWKTENNIVVEMSADEKEYVDKKEIYEAKKIEFQGKRFKITVATLSEEDTGFMYVLANYPQLQAYCNSQKSIITEIDQNTLTSFAHLDELTGYFDNIINSDDRFIKEDVESFNPDNN